MSDFTQRLMLAVKMGQTFLLSPEEAKQLYIVSRLHDLGQITDEDRQLDKLFKGKSND